MDIFDIVILILCIIFVILIIVNVNIINYKRKKKHKEENTFLSQEEIINKPKPLTIGLYKDIFNIFKEGTQYVGIIEELNLLIENNAEIQPTILNEAKELDYKYYDTLFIWRDSYLKQFNLYYFFMRDTFNAVAPGMQKEVRQEFFKQLSHIGAFLDIENNKYKGGEKYVTT